MSCTKPPSNFDRLGFRGRLTDVRDTESKGVLGSSVTVPLGLSSPTVSERGSFPRLGLPHGKGILPCLL